jgi:hypothetical protein
VVKHGSLARTVDTLDGIRIHFVIITYLLTCLLTAWKGVLEKLTGSQLIKKFQAFYRPRSFIAAFTSARHLSTFSARSVLSMQPSPLPEDQVLPNDQSKHEAHTFMS